MLKIESNWAKLVLSIDPLDKIPALLTSTSKDPNFLIVLSTILSTSPSFVTSATMVKGSTPSETVLHFSAIWKETDEYVHGLFDTAVIKICERTFSRFSLFLPTRTTVAFSDANRTAVAAPIPELAPVITDTFPFKDMLTGKFPRLSRGKIRKKHPG